MLTSAHVPSTAAFNHTAFWGADNLTEFYSDDVLLPTLGSPTNLTWVKHPVDEKYPEGAVPGMMFWTNPELGQARRIIRLYAGQPASSTELDSFTDIDKANDYALTALRWAVEKGIISGKGSGTLDPTGNATRAEVAQMLMNYFK